MFGNFMDKTKSKTIVFVHGLFMNPSIWDDWVQFFKDKGFTSYTPAYPHHEGTPLYLHKNYSRELRKLTFGQVVDSLSIFIDKLNETPILIGHSMGGLIVQKLMENGKGTAGVCIAPAPPMGIMSFNWSFLRANLPVINPLKGNSVFIPSVAWFHYALCNTMTLEQTQTEYDRFVVPESRNIPRTSTLMQGYIDFKKPHQPLLIIAAENDHIVPSSLCKKNFKAYKKNNSKIDFKEFSGRSHYICREENWQEVVQFINKWLMPFI